MIATSKVRDAFHRDPDKFQPNPLGPGYLTREERWREAIAYCRKMDAKRQFHWEQERDGVFACRENDKGDRISAAWQRGRRTPP